MVVTGTEQRVYGTLTGGCMIDLHRFALVSGSTTQSPVEASTITYADTTPYKQCGYKYAGYLTLFLSISGSSVYAAVEVRICKNDPKRIVIETYGEVAKTVTGGMSLWFNKGTDKHFPTRDDFPETGSSNVNYINDATGKYYIWNETLYEEGSCWVKLNSTTSGVIMPYATISYTFKESKRNGSTTIDCCKKCPSCECKTCNITGLSLSYKSPAGWPNGIGIRIIGDPFAALDSEITQISDNEKLETIKYSQGYKYPDARWYILTTNSHNFNTNITTNNIQFWSENDTQGAWLVISGDSIEYPYPGGEELFPGNITVSYYGSSGTVSPSSTSSYGYTNNGDYTAFFASPKSFIEYKLKCDSLQFWIGDTGSHESQNKLYYTDMDTGEVHLLGTLEPGQATGTITTSFPFDYLKNCTTTSLSFTGCKTITVPFQGWLTTPSYDPTVYTANMVATISSTPKSNCIEIDTYTDYTWDMNYGKSPSVPFTGKTVTYDYSTLVNFETLTTQSFNVYVKTGDILMNDPKYLEKSTTGCISVVFSNSVSWSPVMFSCGKSGGSPEFPILYGGNTYILKLHAAGGEPSASNPFLIPIGDSYYTATMELYSSGSRNHVYGSSAGYHPGHAIEDKFIGGMAGFTGTPSIQVTNWSGGSTVTLRIFDDINLTTPNTLLSSYTYYHNYNIFNGGNYHVSWETKFVALDGRLIGVPAGDSQDSYIAGTLYALDSIYSKYSEGLDVHPITVTGNGKSDAGPETYGNLCEHNGKLYGIGNYGYVIEIDIDGSSATMTRVMQLPGYSGTVVSIWCGLCSCGGVLYIMVPSSGYYPTIYTYS